MGKIILEISISLDGFAAGANVSAANPMGDGGGRLLLACEPSHGAIALQPVQGGSEDDIAEVITEGAVPA